ncbi:MAG TPA: lytic transglycosylase domain-containing protein [Sphingomicrobium sp.]|nr:lytic transglycosylase domain-containing protein [Sphingomicrobium sp.]
MEGFDLVDERRRMIGRSALAIALALIASPALAQEDPLAPIEVPPVIETPIDPIVITPPPPPRVIPRDWRGVFDAIRAGDWYGAAAGIETLPDSVLKPVARAELYTARGSPMTELAALIGLISEAPDLPQAEQLQRLAMTRGAIELPPIIYTRRTIGLGSAPRRGRARPVANDLAADALRTALEPFVSANDPLGAESLLLGQAAYLTIEARAEAGQRVAWIYYVLGRDAEARRVADQWRAGATGEWGAQAAWVSGLASWRMNDCASSKAAFGDAMRLGGGTEFRAAAAYWSARSAQACRRTREVQPLLLAAAQSAESFYGLLARDALGMTTTLAPPRRFNPSSRVAGLSNIRRATELVAIGERAMAEQMLRHQAKIGAPADHGDLIAAARSLDLGGAQFWLAHNGQPGVRVDPADRYPAPRWVPDRGWRIDPALAFAHVLQESSFRVEAVSPAGAVGLMQVRPGTAGDTARARGESVGINGLKRAETNLDHGQAFIELIRRSGATGGQLPKVIAAYNAGPVPVARWNYTNDKGDPLLWMESIPYWETRYYVPAVLRNMWVYQGLAGAAQPSLRALTEHRWPVFPTSAGRPAL